LFGIIFYLKAIHTGAKLSSNNVASTLKISARSYANQSKRLSKGQQITNRENYELQFRSGNQMEARTNSMEFSASSPQEKIKQVARTRYEENNLTIGLCSAHHRYWCTGAIVYLFISCFMLECCSLIQ